MFKVPKYEFVLAGPALDKKYCLKICKKLLLIKCKKVSFVNNNINIELPSVTEDDMINDESVDNDKNLGSDENENIDNINELNVDIVSKDNDDNLEDSGRSR